MANGKLEFINEDEELTLEQRAEINRKINRPAPVKLPEPPKRRISVKWFVLIVNIVMLITEGVCGVLFANQFYYFNILQKDAFWLGAFFIVLPVVISFFMFVLWKKFRLLLKYSLCALLLLTVLISIFTMSLFGFACPANSVTTDTKNYFVFDPVPGITDTALPVRRFPQIIPGNVSGVNYYYCYSKGVHPAFNVFVEWTLPSEQAMLDEIKRVEDINMDIVEKTVKGDYTCYYFKYADLEMKKDTYEIMMFAFNRKTLSVRYTYCTAKGYETEGKFVPYYENLIW